jgi:hypothetical protein
MIGDRSKGSGAMRAALALGLLLILCATAAAAPVRHHRARQPPLSQPPAEVRPTARFAVPGWSDESTRQWLDNASCCIGGG